MQYLFFGTLYSHDQENILLEKSYVGLQNQANNFQWALINGLDSVLEKPISIANVLPVGTFPKQYKEIILKSRSWSHIKGALDREIGSINIPIFKQSIRALRSKALLRKWTKDNSNADNLVLIIYSTYLPFLWAIRKLPSKVKVILIVTDVPQYNDLQLKRNSIQRLLRQLYNTLIYSSLKRIDAFVLVTEQMKNIIDMKGRPHIVIEGILPSKSKGEVEMLQHKVEQDKSILLYTGTLNYAFGIKALLDAFQLISSERFELWICGAGEAEKEIVEFSMKDKRIKYFGYLSNAEVREMQNNATILINPRANVGEYTKYSFPSKTMEYLASGKPVLMHKLDGIPEEYDSYMYYFNGTTPEKIAERIIEVCGQGAEQRQRFAAKAKEFVINNKNASVQAKKLVEMIEVNFQNH